MNKIIKKQWDKMLHNSLEDGYGDDFIRKHLPYIGEYREVLDFLADHCSGFAKAIRGIFFDEDIDCLGYMFVETQTKWETYEFYAPNGESWKAHYSPVTIHMGNQVPVITLHIKGGSYMSYSYEIKTDRWNFEKKLGIKQIKQMHGKYLQQVLIGNKELVNGELYSIVDLLNKLYPCEQEV